MTLRHLSVTDVLVLSVTDVFVAYQDAEMLYDLEKDPEENQNRADNPEYAEVIEQLRSALGTRMQQAASYE